MTALCVRDHAVSGSHAPPCTCTPECPGHDGHCPGCLPAGADRGLLCARCADRLEGFLGGQEGLGEVGREVHGLPWAYDHIQHAYPSLSQVPGGGGSSVDDAEAERLAAVVSLRADIHDVLAAWADAVAERLQIHRILSPVPAGERLRVRRRAEWLLTHADVLHAHPAAADAWQELADLMSRAHALAPWRPAPTHIDGVPCRCQATALHDHGSEILCWSCRRVFTREEYRVLTVVLARRFAREDAHA